MESAISEREYEEDSETDIRIQRRTFLGTCVLTAGTGTLFGPANDRHITPARRPLTDFVLNSADVGEGYVAWRVPPDASPLLDYLKTAINGFDRTESAVIGFVAREARAGPTYIESAAFETPAIRLTDVARATTAWLEHVHGDGSITIDTSADTVTWVVESDRIIDVLLLQSLDDRFLFTAAYGERSAQVSPFVAVKRYAQCIRERAS